MALNARCVFEVVAADAHRDAEMTRLATLGPLRYSSTSGPEVVTIAGGDAAVSSSNRGFPRTQEVEEAMGTGRYRDGKFEFTAVANFAMTGADRNAWERTFRKASELLWNASEGQLCFGRVFVCDESMGLDTAEMVLHATGDPSYATGGGYGAPGGSLHLMPYVRTAGPLTILHELGHSVFGLGEEYSAPLEQDEIDDTTPAPDNSTIPIVDTGRAVNELVGKQAILKFGALIERHAVTGNTATTVTVGVAFSDLPTNSDYAYVYYQSAAECSNVAGSNYCIMESSRGAAGTFNAAGVWTPAVNPVTEFCSASNHDPDGDTDQEADYHQSCWETIVGRPGFTDLVAPDPAGGAMPGGFVNLEWILLEKQPRFSLVLDRSGSMGAGTRMADARHGAIYWLEFCALATDLLSIHWYDHAMEDILADLTEVSTLAGLGPQVAAINALTPRGSTNIRDGLFRALDAMNTPATRAATQVVLLLTDGQHNTPAGSSATEVLPDFQDSGVRIYALGVGDPASVDMGTLDTLADGTGGRSYAVGDAATGEIEARMVEINAEVRGGIITTEPRLFPDSRRGEGDRFLAPYLEQKKKVAWKKRPPLKAILKAFRVPPLAGLPLTRRQTPRVIAIPVPVEERVGRVSFSAVFDEPGQVWLYLLDPDGAQYSGPRMKQVVSSSPHEFAVVEEPKPGLWHMVLVRVRPGGAFTVRAVAGVENAQLQVFGGTRSHNPEREVALFARARYRHELTGLRVTAEIIGPDGVRQRVALHDAEADEPASGSYQASFRPTKLGRHRGLIRIANTGKASLAAPLRLARHGIDGKIDFACDAPQFVRVVPFTFDAGKRPELRPTQEAPGGTGRKRKTRLVSAGKKRA